MKKSTRRLSLIPSSRWAAYATAGAATTFAGTAEVQAEIHYSGPVRAVFDVGTHSTSEGFFALDGGASLVFDFGRFGGGRGEALFEVEGAAAANSFRGSQPGGAGFVAYVEKLTQGEPISSGNFVAPGGFGVLADSHANGASQWKGPAKGYIGFRFNTGSGLQYGWARIRKHGDNSFVLLDYAWGDPGDAIVAGQRGSRAQNGSLGWLALGADGLVAWRDARAARPTSELVSSH